MVQAFSDYFKYILRGYALLLYVASVLSPGRINDAATPAASTPVMIPKDNSVDTSYPKNSPPILQPTKPNTAATAGRRYTKSSTALASSVNKLLRLRIAHILEV